VPPVNPLDAVLERLRARWVTNPQYRAVVSGLLTLMAVVGLCSCAGIVSLVTNNVLASGAFLSSGTSNSVAAQSTSNTVLRGVVFPTETIPAWTPGVIPGAPPVPNSQTPVPSPTARPKATPRPTACPSNCGGGEHGGTATVTWPAPWTVCTGGSACDQLQIHTSVPNNRIILIITACNGTIYLSQTDPQYANATTDSQGNLTFLFNEQGPNTRAAADVSLTTQSGASARVSPPCA
jgi:hypothetical protein